MAVQVKQGDSPPGVCAQCGVTEGDLRPVNPRYGWGAAQSYLGTQHWCWPCRREFKGQWRWTPLERFRQKRRKGNQ